MTPDQAKVHAELRKLETRMKRYVARQIRKEVGARRALERDLANLAPGETYHGGSAR